MNNAEVDWIVEKPFFFTIQLFKTNAFKPAMICFLQVNIAAISFLDLTFCITFD